MASTTALTLVNRLLRRHGFEDYSAFTLPETLLALDLVNQAIQDLLAVRDYPWNIRSNGQIRLRPPQSDTAGCSITTSTATIQVANWTGTMGDYVGNSSNLLVAKFLGTGATSHTDTAMTVLTFDDTLGPLVATLNNQFPGGNQTNIAFKFYFDEYVLGDEVAKVLSVRHQDQPVRLVEVPPHSTLDEVLPRRHDSEGSPEVIAVGGTSTATYDTVNGTVTAGTNGLRLVVWPPPDARYLLDYSYKERLDPLSATTDTLVCPDEFVWDVIDRAEALSNMTQRFNAPDLAAQQMRASLTNAERKWTNSVLDPNRRHSLRAHDSVDRRRDPTKMRDITGL